MTQVTESTSQAWTSFLATHSTRRVFVFDAIHLRTAPGLNDFLRMLQNSGVTPVVITHFATVPNFGDLMNDDFQNPLDLPTFNVSPDVSVGDLVALASGIREISGCASDFEIDDSIAHATTRAGGIVFAYRSTSRNSMHRLPIEACVISDFAAARSHHYMQQRIGGC